MLLSFLLTGFCDLIQKHIGGGERFANFLVLWYNFVGSIAVHSLCTEGSWRHIPELSGVCKEDRSLLVHSVANCVYASLQKLVGSNWKAKVLYYRACLRYYVLSNVVLYVGYFVAVNVGYSSNAGCHDFQQSTG